MFKPKRYYREWLKACGWAVMLGYDTVMAKSKRQAKRRWAASMYALDRSFETTQKVKRKHLHLTDEQLSKIYRKKKSNMLSLVKRLINGRVAHDLTDDELREANGLIDKGVC